MSVSSVLFSSQLASQLAGQTMVQFSAKSREAAREGDRISVQYQLDRMAEIPVKPAMQPSGCEHPGAVSRDYLTWAERQHFVAGMLKALAVLNTTPEKARFAQDAMTHPAASHMVRQWAVRALQSLPNQRIRKQTVKEVLAAQGVSKHTQNWLRDRLQPYSA